MREYTLFYQIIKLFRNQMKKVKITKIMNF